MPVREECITNTLYIFMLNKNNSFMPVGDASRYTPASGFVSVQKIWAS